MKLISICILSFWAALPCLAQRFDTAAVRQDIDSLLSGVDAEVGVAVISGAGDTLTVHNGQFPLLSVFKFHQALAVCHWLRNAGLPLSTELQVAAGELETDTWSPLRDKHPAGGRFSVAQLLDYTLQYSDNNACDLLFSKTCSVEQTAQYIRSLGVADFTLECTEKIMHEEAGNAYRNNSSPLSAAILLEKFYALRHADAYFSYLWQTMSGCRTGLGRIPKYIEPHAAAIVHKTGTGDVNGIGKIIAVNDIGIVVLPDGGHYSLAVFIKDAACSMEQCEELVAQISLAVFKAFCPENPD